MTYVGNIEYAFGRMKMFHMVADTLDELFEMADKIGVQRKWFQDHEIPHFDICKSKKHLALQQGASEISDREIVKIFKLHERLQRKTVVVNIRQQKYDVYCGRAGKGKDGYFGNPFRSEDGNAIEKFRKYFYNRLKADPEYRKRVFELKGKILGCFCKPKPCHCDIIASFLNIL